ncbi:hypothetical protein JCM10207_005461 [Rhodosporidiobolus poonsookiae]
MPVGATKKDRISPLGQEAVASSTIFKSAFLEHRFLSNDPKAIKVISRVVSLPLEQRREAWDDLGNAAATGADRASPAELDNALQQIQAVGKGPSSSEQSIQTQPSEEQPTNRPQAEPHLASLSTFIAQRTAIPASALPLSAPAPLCTAYSGGAADFKDFLASHPVTLPPPSAVSTAAAASNAALSTSNDHSRQRGGDNRSQYGMDGPRRMTFPNAREIDQLLDSPMGARTLSDYIRKPAVPAGFTAQVIEKAASRVVSITMYGKPGLLLNSLVLLANPAQANFLAKAYLGHVSEVGVVMEGRSALESILKAEPVDKKVKTELEAEAALHMGKLGSCEPGSRLLQFMMSGTGNWSSAVLASLSKLAYNTYGRYIVRQAMQKDEGLVKKILLESKPFMLHAMAHDIVYDMIALCDAENPTILFPLYRQRCALLTFNPFGAPLVCKYLERLSILEPSNALPSLIQMLCEEGDAIERATVSFTGVIVAKCVVRMAAEHALPILNDLRRRLLPILDKIPSHKWLDAHDDMLSKLRPKKSGPPEDGQAAATDAAGSSGGDLLHSDNALSASASAHGREGGDGARRGSMSGRGEEAGWASGSGRGGNGGAGTSGGWGDDPW